jgi:hypothetical protein
MIAFIKQAKALIVLRVVLITRKVNAHVGDGKRIAPHAYFPPQSWPRRPTLASASSESYCNETSARGQGRCHKSASAMAVGTILTRGEVT